MKKMLKLKGLVEIRKIYKDGRKEFIGEYPNLLVDDGKEYLLDFFGGRKSWHSPAATTSGSAGLLTFTRYIGAGRCMFNNSSLARAEGLNGIPTGSEASYPIATTELVSPEDSFLSREVGNRILATVNRRDQTLEFIATFNIPGDIPSGVKLREFGIFLQPTGPANDPSFTDVSKPQSMLCRTVLWGSGTIGGSGVYFDSPINAVTDIEIRWKFGEI